jgi:hypothetical protein
MVPQIDAYPGERVTRRWGWATGPAVRCGLCKKLYVGAYNNVGAFDCDHCGATVVLRDKEAAA